MPASQTFYELASSRLDDQMNRVDSLDAKAASALAFAAALLPVFGAIIALSKAQRPAAGAVLYVTAMLVYAALLVCVLKAYRVTNWDLRPDIPTLQTYSQTQTEDAMRTWVGNECVISIGRNEKRLTRKAQWITAALALLAVDALLLSTAALLTIW